MRTVRTHAVVGLTKLEAPAVLGYAFLGGTGWYGAQCSCGFIVSGRSLVALEGGLQDHQVADHYPAWAEYRAQQAE